MSPSETLYTKKPACLWSYNLRFPKTNDLDQLQLPLVSVSWITSCVVVLFLLVVKENAWLLCHVPSHPIRRFSPLIPSRNLKPLSEAAKRSAKLLNSQSKVGGWEGELHRAQQVSWCTKSYGHCTDLFTAWLQRKHPGVCLHTDNCWLFRCSLPPGPDPLPVLTWLTPVFPLTHLPPYRSYHTDMSRLEFCRFSSHSWEFLLLEMHLCCSFHALFLSSSAELKSVPFSPVCLPLPLTLLDCPDPLDDPHPSPTTQTCTQ